MGSAASIEGGGEWRILRKITARLEDYPFFFITGSAESLRQHDTQRNLAKHSSALFITQCILLGRGWSIVKVLVKLINT